MNLLVAGLFSAFKKNILQLLLIGGVVYGLYYYVESVNTELDQATQQADDLAGDNKRLEDEAKDLKEQSPIDIKAVGDHQSEQGNLEVVQEVAIEKVQHEVTRVLQTAPVADRDSKSTADAVSNAVINGMWDSYKGTVRGGTSTKASK